MVLVPIGGWMVSSSSSSSSRFRTVIVGSHPFEGILRIVVVGVAVKQTVVVVAATTDTCR
jgi:hypothetical protein